MFHSYPSGPEDGSLEVDGVLQPYILNGYAPRWHSSNDVFTCIYTYESDRQAKWIQIDAKLSFAFWIDAIFMAYSWHQFGLHHLWRQIWQHGIAFFVSTMLSFRGPLSWWPDDQNTWIQWMNGGPTSPDSWWFSYIYIYVHEFSWFTMVHYFILFHQHWPWYVAVHHHVHRGHLLPTLQLLRLIRAREPREWMARGLRWMMMIRCPKWQADSCGLGYLELGENT